MHWLSRLKPEEMRGGTLIAATMHERRITGMIVFGNYGLSESFIAVHPEFRRKGVGETLLRHALSRLKKVYTRVAFDNIPSLKLCFACGLSAFHIVKGPTGKPTLWLGGGTFDPSEVSKETEHIKEMGSP
jgi:GNAT superfamily N-acetyltransferase